VKFLNNDSSNLKEQLLTMTRKC